MFPRFFFIKSATPQRTLAEAIVQTGLSRELSDAEKLAKLKHAYYADGRHIISDMSAIDLIPPLVLAVSQANRVAVEFLIAKSSYFNPFNPYVKDREGCSALKKAVEFKDEQEQELKAESNEIEEKRKIVEMICRQMTKKRHYLIEELKPVIETAIQYENRFFLRNFLNQLEDMADGFDEDMFYALFRLRMEAIDKIVQQDKKQLFCFMCKDVPSTVGFAIANVLKENKKKALEWSREFIGENTIRSDSLLAHVLTNQNFMPLIPPPPRCC